MDDKWLKEAKEQRAVHSRVISDLKRDILNVVRERKEVLGILEQRLTMSLDNPREIGVAAMSDPKDPVTNDNDITYAVQLLVQEVGVYQLYYFVDRIINEEA